MNIRISEEVLKKTTECKKNFSCLSDKKRDWCEAESSPGYDTLFVKVKRGNSCKYLIPYVDSFLCICPTRNEIYKRYGI